MRTGETGSVPPRKRRFNDNLQGAVEMLLKRLNVCRPSDALSRLSEDTQYAVFQRIPLAQERCPACRTKEEAEARITALGFELDGDEPRTPEQAAVIVAKREKLGRALTEAEVQRILHPIFILSDRVVSGVISSAEVLTLSHPDAFAVWAAERLAEDASEANRVFDMNIRIFVIDASIFVSGTACLERYNRDDLAPAEALKKHIEDLFGSDHPYAKALIVWSVNQLKPDSVRANRFTAEAPICASAFASIDSDLTTLAHEKLITKRSDHRKYAAAWAGRSGRGETRIRTGWFRCPHEIPGYETALLSSFGRAGWSCPISGHPKDAPERIASAFAHYAAEIAVATGLLEECAVTVRTDVGSDRIDCVDVCAYGDDAGRKDMAKALAEEIAGWDLRFENLYKVLKLGTLDLPKAVEEGRFGRPPELGIPVAEAPFVRDSSFFERRAPIFINWRVIPRLSGA